MREIGEREWQRCAEDVLYWVDIERHPALPYVYTHDPHIYYHCVICNDENTYAGHDRRAHLRIAHKLESKDNNELRLSFNEVPTVRPFPLHDYMLPIIDVWLNKQFVLVQKSRDMIVTWTTVMLYSWDTFFHEGRQNIFQSENSRKTNELVRRAWLIFKNQPKFLRQVHPFIPSMGIAKSGIVRCEELNSEIIGFPQGAEQLRQYHPSGVFLDEAAILVDAGNTFASVKPSIQSGGRFTAVSSASPGWFQYACEDRLEDL